MQTADNSFRSVVRRQHIQLYETFVQAFEQTARELAIETGEIALQTISVSRRQLDRWLSGELKSLPRPRQCRVLERMLGIPVDELFDVGRQPEMPLDEDQDESALRKVRLAAAQSAQAMAMAEAHSIGTYTLEELESQLQRLMVAFAFERAATSFEQFSGFQTLLSGHILTCREPEILRRLYRCSAVTSSVMAKTAHDIGDMNSALTLCRAGLFAADRAGDQATTAVLRCVQSVAHFWLGDTKSSIESAQQGLEVVGMNDTRVWLLNLSARAHAFLGNNREAWGYLAQASTCRDALEESESELAPTNMAFIMTFGEQIQIGYEALTKAWIAPDSADSLAVAREAVSLFTEHADTEGAYGVEINYRTVLAGLLLRRGDFDGASKIFEPALSMNEPALVNSFVRCLTWFKADLQRYVEISPIAAKMMASASSLLAVATIEAPRFLPVPVLYRQDVDLTSSVEKEVCEQVGADADPATVSV